MNLYLLGCFSAGNTDQFQYMHTLFYLQALFKRTKDLVGLPNIDSDGSLSLMVIVIKKNDEHDVKMNWAPLLSANNKPQNTHLEIELKCALRLMLSHVRM